MLCVDSRVVPIIITLQKRQHVLYMQKGGIYKLAINGAQLYGFAIRSPQGVGWSALVDVFRTPWHVLSGMFGKAVIMIGMTLL